MDLLLAIIIGGITGGVLFIAFALFAWMLGATFAIMQWLFWSGYDWAQRE